MKSLNRIENLLCTSIENVIVKLLLKFQSDPCNPLKFAKIEKSGFEKNAFKV